MTEAAELRRVKICRKTEVAFENERLMKEVNELLHNFQRAFDSLVSKHEQFTMLFDDDGEYENEQK